MNTKFLSAVIKFSLVLLLLCLFMVFWVDKGSAEFVIMVISSVINAVILGISSILLNIKIRKKDKGE